MSILNRVAETGGANTGPRAFAGVGRSGRRRSFYPAAKPGLFDAAGGLQIVPRAIFNYLTGRGTQSLPRAHTEQKMRRLRHTTLFLFALFAACALPPAPALAHEGWGIVVDGRGHVYFTDIPTNTVWRLTRDGRLEAVARDRHSHALVLSGETIYGTDHHPTLPVRAVWTLAPDGRTSDLVPPTHGFPLGLQSFLVDPQGNIYSSNPYVAPGRETLLLRRTADGAVTELAGGPKGFADGRGREARFEMIDGMTLGPDGALYLTDGPHVRRATPEGEVTTLNREPLTTKSWGEDLMGLAFGGDGNLYVADYSGRRVLRLSPQGEAGLFMESGGLAWAPTGVVFEGPDAYVLEHLRAPLNILGDLRVGPYARVRKVMPGGRVEHLATLWGRYTALFIAGVLFVVALLAGALVALRRRRRRQAAA